MRRAVSLTAAVALALGGCTQDFGDRAFRRDLSAELPKTDIEKQALIGNLFQAYTAACADEASARGHKATTGQDGSGARRKRGKHAAALAAARSVAAAAPRPHPAEACIVRTDVDGEDVTNYLAAGFTLSDYLCETFFRHVNKSARMRQFGRGETNVVGTLMGTILSLSHAGGIATGATTAAFGAADHAFQNFNDSYMVAPDLSNLRHLVLAAQDHMRQTSLATPPKTMFGAESTILRYAGLCSFLGMQDLLAASVKEKADDIDRVNASDADKDKAGAGARTPAEHAAGKKRPDGHRPAPQAAAAAAPGRRMYDMVIEHPLVAPPPPSPF